MKRRQFLDWAWFVALSLGVTLALWGAWLVTPRLTP